MNNEDISVLFHQYFDVIYAHNTELREHCFKIRYDVYCDELGFEDSSAFKDMMEVDECDTFSHHYLIQHRSSGEYAGTVRLVDPFIAATPSICPIEKYCIDSIQDTNYSPKVLGSHSICEVSRLAVPSRFRRRAGEQGKPFVYESDRVSFTELEKKTFPFIAVGLYLAAASHFVLAEHLHHILVMMEPRLALHLRRVGIDFKQIGDVVEYHGQRAAYHVDEDRLLKKMRPHMRQLYDSIYSRVKEQVSSNNPQHHFVNTAS